MRVSETPPGRLCRCELTVPAALLDGYACGRPDCWRTEVVARSFEEFVGDVVRDRENASTLQSVVPKPQAE